jgi:putative tryptophan/tyrosine transport system substrate-binding protein
LLAYGPGYADAFRLWGQVAGRVLRGTRPSDLPIEQPTTFRLVVNLKTVRELGVALPSRLVERADEVVE